MAYRLTRKAEEDLTEIYLASVRDFGNDRAEAYLEGLIRTFDVLARHPELARLRYEFRPPVRIHPHRAHIVIFREDGPDVLVIRIRHGREDWSRNE